VTTQFAARVRRLASWPTRPTGRTTAPPGQSPMLDS